MRQCQFSVNVIYSYSNKSTSATVDPRRSRTASDSSHDSDPPLYVHSKTSYDFRPIASVDDSDDTQRLPMTLWKILNFLILKRKKPLILIWFIYFEWLNLLYYQYLSELLCAIRFLFEDFSPKNPTFFARENLPKNVFSTFVNPFFENYWKKNLMVVEWYSISFDFVPLPLPSRYHPVTV